MNIEKLIIFVKKLNEWFASCWDIKSQNFISQFNTKNKIASAMLPINPIDAIIEEKTYLYFNRYAHHRRNKESCR